jgi:predicted HicB family RNase H-like nuclease
MKHQIVYTPYRTEHDGADRLVNAATAAVKGLKKMAKSAAKKYSAWAELQNEKRATAEMWAYAKQDPRLMAEIQASANRQGIVLNH